jgi:cellulose synthase/poly-beta-1,6-N-acetylglucosamine synthase-like glycosyltransferase
MCSGNDQQETSGRQPQSRKDVMQTESEPLVSIITPVYNGEKFIPECLESIRTQTYSNFEHIIVNNCSTDRTLEIAQDYASRDSRVRIHNNNEFVTALENHNIALKLISPESKYIKIVQHGCRRSRTSLYRIGQRLPH